MMLHNPFKYLRSLSGSKLIGLILALMFIAYLAGPVYYSVKNSVEVQDRRRNLRVIGQALLKTNLKGVDLTQAICRPNGRPLLSWRVAILAYLDDPAANDLYKQFKLDEPWDSPHNYALLSKMPDIYRSPGVSLPEHHTLMKVFVTGPGYENGKYRPLWPASGPSHIKEVLLNQADDIGLTILAAEIGIPVPWTKPEDIVIDASIEDDKTDFDFQVNMILRYGQSLAFHAVMADASVRTFRLSNPSSKTNKKLLRPYLEYEDGETVDDSVFD